MNLGSAVGSGGSLHIRFQDLGLESPAKIVFSARKGIMPSLFYSFAQSVKMSEKNLARLLHTHSRTIGNYRELQKKLDPVVSEHLLKLIALFIKGEQLFGNVDEFNYWLQKPFWNNTEKPVDWLITPGGVDLLSDELDRLAHGYAV
jgi:putative toxin-antitoxin system antitoxin component (TIGR02293 family)